MRSLFKFSLAALLALVLGAGSAMALDVKWSGNIGAGFGRVSYGETGVGKGAGDNARVEYVTSYEANIRATIGGGPLTMIHRLRPRGNQSSAGGQTNSSATGNTGALADIYTEVWWKPTDAFSVGFGRFQGQAWSQPMSGTYLINHPLGAPEYFMNWTGIDGIDLEFNAGVVQVGFAIASECRPSCNTATITTVGGDAIASGTGNVGTAGETTMVPHLTGKFGDIGLRASMPSTSKSVGNGSAATKEEIETLTGSGMQVGVSWSGMQGVFVGFDYQSFTDAGNKKVASAAGALKEDQVRTGMGLRVDFSGFQLGYHSLKTTGVGNQKDVETTGTWIKLAYFIQVGDGSIVPEYTTYTVVTDKKPAADPDSVNNNLLRIVGNMPF